MFRHEKSHEYDESLSCLQRSLEIDPNNTTIKLKMANIQGIIEKFCVYVYLNFIKVKLNNISPFKQLKEINHKDLYGPSLPGEKNKYELNQLFSLNLKKTYLFE